MERLLEEVSFSACKGGVERLAIDAGYVDSRLSELAQNEDLSRYVL
jgi:ATP-dependent HslUV protease ATP-binding subunit HslU